MSKERDIDKYLKRLKKGEQCFDEFFRAYAGKIKFIAYSYLIDKFYIDDVVMNTFCRILKSIQHYREEANGMAWVCRIAQNEAYRINNSERRFAYVSIDAIGDHAGYAKDTTGLSELMADLDRALNTLEGKEKQIATMRILDGLNYPEIAEELDMYVGTVYKCYQRALKVITEAIL